MVLIMRCMVESTVGVSELAGEGLGGEGGCSKMRRLVERTFGGLNYGPAGGVGIQSLVLLMRCVTESTVGVSKLAWEGGGGRGAVRT